MHETGCLGLVHWDDPEGWDGEGGERGVQDGGHMYTHGWFMSMYGKKPYNIVKELASNYNKLINFRIYINNIKIKRNEIILEKIQHHSWHIVSAKYIFIDFFQAS